METVSIAVIMTVFNRVEKTKKCIDSIIEAKRDSDYRLSFYITDDGSTDTTRELLTLYISENPDVDFHICEGSGSLFWNKGMFLAYGEALKTTHDFYLWVNNDVEFIPGFIDDLVKDSKDAEKETSLYLICGSVSFRDREELSYGGSINLSKTNPYKRRKVIPNGKIQKCDCINGNCVLIPAQTAVNLGNMEERYEHAYGDFDYGFQLIANGGQPFIASSYVGVCDRNPSRGTWNDPKLPISVRVKKKNAPTGVPLKSHNLFLKKWFPTFRLYYLFSPYVGIVISSLKYKIMKKGI